jgi:hypothetical protein
MHMRSFIHVMRKKTLPFMTGKVDRINTYNIDF